MVVFPLDIKSLVELLLGPMVQRLQEQCAKGKGLALIIEDIWELHCQEARGAQEQG